jgi:hypothetical protein
VSQTWALSCKFFTLLQFHSIYFNV